MRKRGWRRRRRRADEEEGGRNGNGSQGGPPFVLQAPGAAAVPPDAPQAAVAGGVGEAAVQEEGSSARQVAPFGDGAAARGAPEGHQKRAGATALSYIERSPGNCGLPDDYLTPASAIAKNQPASIQARTSTTRPC